MRALLPIMLAATPALADELWVAGFTTDDNVTVYKLSPTAKLKLYADKSAQGAGWTDAKTLWILHHDTKTNGVWVNKVVEGKLADKLVIPFEAWKAADGLGSVRLKITTRNEVWVENCINSTDETRRACAKGKWIRVDTAKQALQTTVPAGIDPYRAQGSPGGKPPPFPAAKAPKGYTVTLSDVVVDGSDEDQKQRKVKGAVCKGPSASKTWPEPNTDLSHPMTPTKVTWVRETPAVARLDVTATIAGIVMHAEVVFLDCKDVADEARWLGAGYWALRRAEVWTIYNGDRSIGSIAGYDLRSPSK